MTEIKIESDAMQAIVSKAILEGIDGDQRQAILEQAVAALITPRGERGYGRPEPTTPLQDAFDAAVRGVVNEVAREVVVDDPALRDKVRELITSAMADAVKEPYTKLSDAVRTAVADNILGY
jgi:hypothetical protein